MTIQELETMMQENLGIKMVILNNNYLGMVRQWQELFHGKRYSSTLMANPDFIAIANAYKIKGKEISDRESLDEGIKEMFADDSAFLLIVNVEQFGLVYPMVPAGTAVTNILLGE